MPVYCEDFQAQLSLRYFFWRSKIVYNVIEKEIDQLLIELYMTSIEVDVGWFRYRLWCGISIVCDAVLYFSVEIRFHHSKPHFFSDSFSFYCWSNCAVKSLWYVLSVNTKTNFKFNPNRTNGIINEKCKLKTHQLFTIYLFR